MRKRRMSENPTAEELFEIRSLSFDQQIEMMRQLPSTDPIRQRAEFALRRFEKVVPLGLFSKEVRFAYIGFTNLLVLCLRRLRAAATPKSHALSLEVSAK